MAGSVVGGNDRVGLGGRDLGRPPEPRRARYRAEASAEILSAFADLDAAPGSISTVAAAAANVPLEVPDRVLFLEIDAGGGRERLDHRTTTLDGRDAQ
jgi:hypothetical protein